MNMRPIVFVYVFFATIGRKCSSISSTKSILDRLVVTAKTAATPPIDAESRNSQVAFVPSKVIQTENPEGQLLTDPVKDDITAPSSVKNIETYQENKLSSEIRPKNKPISKVRPKNKRSSKVRPKKQKKMALARQKRRRVDIEEFRPEPEGIFMKFYRREQKEEDYVQCHKIFTPFWRGLKVHPKYYRNVKMFGPEDFLCERLIQILNMNMSMFDVEDLHGVLQVVRKMKLRFFFWHLQALKRLLNTIIDGKHHNFHTLWLGVNEILRKLRVNYSNTTQLLAASLIYRPPCFKQYAAGSTQAVPRPVLQNTFFQTSTKICTSNITGEHFGHTHDVEYGMPTASHKTWTVNDIQRKRHKNEEQYEAKQEYLDDIGGDGSAAENQDDNVEYMEGDLEKTDYVFPNIKEVEDHEQKDPYKHAYSDLDGDEVIRAKYDQYDIEAVENYDHLELPSKEAGDSIALQKFMETTVGQSIENNLENISYEILNEPNQGYEDSTENVVAQNKDEIKGTSKVVEENIYNEAEEYIENIFAGLEKL